MKMLNFGMVGMNQGNGHPYSFSAVFNGFDPKALEESCDFPIIRQYLTAHHGNREFIPNARVSHIWTQDRKLSEKVASVSRIPHIVDSLEELASEVDGIIFARDDIWNHYSMAAKLFRTGKPIYMDKLLCDKADDLRNLSASLGGNYPLMTASSFRYAPLVTEAAEFIKKHPPLTVHGTSPCVWVRYAPHLLDALFAVCGRAVESVQSTGTDKRDTVCITFSNGLQAVLQVFEGMALPMGLSFYFEAPQQPLTVPYTDDSLESYFLSIVNMMKEFTEMADGGARPVPLQETLLLNRIVLAGIISREQGGVRIRMAEFMEDLT